MSSSAQGSAGNGPAAEPSFLPRWAMWLVLPGLLMPVGILAFMGIAQLAHNESRCPFEQRSVQQLAPGVSVQEEARRCLPGTEERRYRLSRAGALRVLGERRLASKAFAAGRYSWTASINDRGEVQVIVHNADHGDVLFREGTAAERAGGPLQPPPTR
jgi:hypothetical protein